MMDVLEAVKKAVEEERERCAALVRAEKLPMNNPRNELLEAIALNIESGTKR